MESPFVSNRRNLIRESDLEAVIQGGAQQLQEWLHINKDQAFALRFEYKNATVLHRVRNRAGHKFNGLASSWLVVVCECELLGLMKSRECPFKGTRHARLVTGSVLIFPFLLILQLLYASNDNDGFWQFDVFRVLVQEGMDVNLVDSDGDTPLHLASNFHMVEVVLLLLEYGADVNKRFVPLLLPFTLLSATNHLFFFEATR